MLSRPFRGQFLHTLLRRIGYTLEVGDMHNFHRIRRLAAVLIGTLLLGRTAPIGAQGASLNFVGIDEKLGAQIALDVDLKDEAGSIVNLRDLINKPTILTLNYFRCAGICTPLLNGLVEALNEIPLEPGNSFQVITISFDSTDTPEIAHQKRINYLEQIKRPFPPAAWRFLTGEAESTRKIADSVGFGYRREGDQYVHPGAIMVLTPTGRVSRYFYGITFLPADLQLAIQEAARGEVNPTIARALAYCYSYDPGSGAYVLNITRIVGTGILLVAGLFVVFILRSRSDGKNKAKATRQSV
jgi:protein SCO1